MKIKKTRKSTRSIVVNDIVLSKFDTHLRYNVSFRSNTFGRGMNTLITFSYGLNSTIIILQQG